MKAREHDGESPGFAAFFLVVPERRVVLWRRPPMLKEWAAGEGGGLGR
jgi:hypothetical protein